MARKRKSLFPFALIGVLALLVFLYVFNIPAEVSEAPINETAEEELPPPINYTYTQLEDNTTLPPKVSVGGQVFIITK